MSPGPDVGVQLFDGGLRQDPLPVKVFDSSDLSLKRNPFSLKLVWQITDKGAASSKIL